MGKPARKRSADYFAATGRVRRQMAVKLLEAKAFRHRGLSERTIGALVDSGIDAPERLLFVSPAQFRDIEGVGKVSFAEIMQYRSRFLPADKITLEFVRAQDELAQAELLRKAQTPPNSGKVTNGYHGDMREIQRVATKSHTVQRQP
jgi:hypothetical protein